MPLIQKPRNPNYGIRKVLKRNVIRRKPIGAFVLLETMAYIKSQGETMSPGQVVDAAIRLYAQSKEQSDGRSKAIRGSKRERLRTTVSQETIAYMRFMRSAMSPGELIDAAIKLYSATKGQEHV